MFISLDCKLLQEILSSKTLVKIYRAILEAYTDCLDNNSDVEGFSFSMEELRKLLRYKNKSTISRGLQRLAELNLINLSTSPVGTVVSFNITKSIHVS